MSATDLDLRVRLAAFEFLARERTRNGGFFPASVLSEGFRFEGCQVRLKGQQGIFKPAILPALPLSITTSPVKPSHPRPYDDGFSSSESILYYKYRGTSPAHHENEGLRRLMKERRPLVYFHGIERATYMAEWPVYIVADEPARLRFLVQMDASVVSDRPEHGPDDTDAPIRRRYATREARIRLHQGEFRARVLRAYRERCALCRLKYQALLDAAHITADSDQFGEPVVSNGVALCKLHHAAFDQDFIAIRPDYKIEVRADVLGARDGPMLLHGLQEMHGGVILLPKQVGWLPDRTRLEERYERFRRASGSL